jgi:hypothetical protein
MPAVGYLTKNRLTAFNTFHPGNVELLQQHPFTFIREKSGTKIEFVDSPASGKGTPKRTQPLYHKRFASVAVRTNTQFHNLLHLTVL